MVSKKVPPRDAIVNAQKLAKDKVDKAHCQFNIMAYPCQQQKDHGYNGEAIRNAKVKEQTIQFPELLHLVVIHGMFAERLAGGD